MTNRRAGVVAFGMGAALLLTWAVAWGLGLRVNTSASIPLGLWREFPLLKTPERGDVIAFCPDDSDAFRVAKSRGYLSPGWCNDSCDEVVFKPVAAVAGDVVIVGARGIAVNGLDMKNTVALRADGQGNPLSAVAAGSYPVNAGTVWLLSDYNQRSFDSRYFGAVPVSQVRGVVIPLLIWGVPPRRTK